MAEINQGVFRTEFLTHPMEARARVALQESIAMNGLAKDIAALKLKLDDSAQMRLGDYLVTEITAPRIFHQYSLVLASIGDMYSCDTADNQVFPLYVTFDYAIRSEVHGSDKDGYMIRITSGAVEALNDDELRALLGQAVGHIRAGHVQFIEMLSVIRNQIDKIPMLGKIISGKMWAAFAHWQFYSDYTADRIGAACAGSIRAVLTLLCKQIGALLPGRTPYMVMEQKCMAMPEAGLYLVWIAQNMPVFNAIGRMHELTRWSKTEEFRKLLPYMYYSACADRGDKPKNHSEEQLFRLHAQAEAGDVDAMAALGECYLREMDGLTGNKPVGLSLTKYAALHGNGGAMYLLYLCSDMESVDFSARLTEQLLRAAEGRCDLGMDAPKLKPRPHLDGLAEIIRGCYDDASHYTVCQNCPGAPIETSMARRIRDIFLMEAQEPVLAYEIYRVNGTYCGTVLSPFGIYGRMPNREMPFTVGWDQFQKNELYMKPLNHKHYLYCGKLRICRTSVELQDSIGELLVIIKSSLE